MSSREETHRHECRDGDDRNLSEHKKKVRVM
jgi:hypothetical protein